MTFFEKAQSATDQSTGRIIYDNQSQKMYSYGENPYYDMIIENCVFSDLFPGELCGFDRSRYAFIK